MKSFYTKKAKIMFMLPGIILFTLFVIYPIIPGFIMSLQDHNGATANGWVGFANYAKALHSKNFWLGHVNTYLAVITELLIGVPLSLLMALILDRSKPGIRAMFKFAALFPSILSVAVVGKMFQGIFATDWGLFNTILRLLGLDALCHSWLSDTHTAMYCICAAYIWQYIGYNTIVFYTGIRGIPKEYYEAATLDGANFFQASTRITLPLLQDVFKFVLTGATTGTLAIYGIISVMTNGGPGHATRTVLFEMFYQAFSMSKFGYGTAIAMLFLLECVFWAFLINHFVAREKIVY